METSLETYSSMTYSERSVVLDQSYTVHNLKHALQTCIDNVLKVEKEPINATVADIQATATKYLPSVAKSHAQYSQLMPRVNSLRQVYIMITESTLKIEPYSITTCT